MVYGARPSILVGVLTTLGAVLLGGFVGAIAGFYGGMTDSVLSRLTDVFFAIPLLLGAIVFLSAFEARNVFTVVLALVVLGWTQIARIMRGAVISVREADFVLAARALGANDRRILGRHILPNALAPVIVVATISLGIFIVAEATLSFLGIGLPPSTVSWGGDISNGAQSLRSTPRILLAPAAALSVTVLSFILLGDAVREALDPRLR
jgi:oligopeptide transport system permease protein